MRIAFLSDIHGNAIALEAVIEDINRKNVDNIIVLGDIAYRGPEPKRSIELVRGLGTDVVKGNADEWVVRGIDKGEVPDHAHELMNEERDWTAAQLTQEDINYLANLPSVKQFEVEGVTFHAFHATPDSLFEVVPPSAEDDTLALKLMKATAADVYLYGHIHQSYIRTINGKTVINLGSVGLPFDGVTKASYAIVEADNGAVSMSIEKVAYDREKTIAKYHEVDYPNTDMMEKIIRTASSVQPPS
ncbi:metallophosphoesterase family protein [Sediminibacillus albus]|uniref:Phosphoesterase n=1 Tax=Sediminibacillus albus TaxID=407036 RepID=A0A1G8YAT3_9BACI|nr:YfcE family phosphodiesterase [Sediminibacillus albus]SDJ99821.1 phosphoesterase, MJ0936 family [Sediminibacillus albus]